MRQDGQATAPKEITVHNVHILDASGSMGTGYMVGSKYSNALGGINEELNILKADTSGVKYTQTIIEFDSGRQFENITQECVNKTTFSNSEGLYGRCRITTHYFLTPLAACIPIIGRGAHGGTPLYQTIGETIEKLLNLVKTTDKVILKIFTDGDENSSSGKYARMPGGYNYRRVTGPVTDCPTLKSLIDAVQENNNFTVTFIGTQGDVGHAINNLGMLSTNTLVHDNTAAGVKMSYMRTASATKSYSGAAARGASVEELKENFFKRMADVQDVQQGIAKVEPKAKKKTK